MRRLLAFLLLFPFAMAAAQAPAPAGPPLWRIEGNGHVLWLLGTVSPLGQDMADEAFFGNRIGEFGAPAVDGEAKGQRIG